jgi:vacuolar iron transporter family protein
VGGIVPVFPYLIFSGNNGLIASSIASMIGLFILGALSAFVTGNNMVRSGIRQIIFGLAAAAVTFGIGKIVGTNIGG